MHSISYIILSFHILEEFQEIAVALLSDLNFEGIEQNADKIYISFKKTNLDIEKTIEEIQTALSSIDSNIQYLGSEDMEEKNWNEEYEKRVKAVVVSDKIGIAPTWKKDELSQELIIEINPKMSFGTGEHSTTKLVARLMEKYVKENDSWIDAGTGTGVLAILAEKLGAKSVFAFDNNDWSISNTIENIELNKCSKLIVKKLDVQHDLDEELPISDGIAANIFTNLIIESLPLFYRKLKPPAPLLCSGIMTYNAHKVKESASEVGFEFIEEITEDEWIALAFQKN
ncbi:MAG: 50S ribosomal protein L11 methyltransferase [Candidatus Kapaibacteriales bacterium]